ncbi:MAG: hypothetical protein Q4B28_07935 [bacterium]|nr:hypothetical protein [bacterium]
MLKLSYDQRNNFLDQPDQHNTKTLREQLIKNNKKHKEEIFRILTAHHYNDFSKLKVFNADTLQRETTNSYQDTKFKRVLANISKIKNVNYLTEKTIKPMITLIKTMQALDKALNSTTPQSKPLQTPLYSPEISDSYQESENKNYDYSDRLRMH